MRDLSLTYSSRSASPGRTQETTSPSFVWMIYSCVFRSVIPSILIPKLWVFMILRVSCPTQGLGAARPGGLNRDVGRTWALGGQGAVEERR